MLPRFLRLHPRTSQRLLQLSKEADRDGAYRVARRLRAVVLNSEGRTSSQLADILKAPRSNARVYSSQTRLCTPKYSMKTNPNSIGIFYLANRNCL